MRLRQRGAGCRCKRAEAPTGLELESSLPGILQKQQGGERDGVLRFPEAGERGMAGSKGGVREAEKVAEGRSEVSGHSWRVGAGERGPAWLRVSSRAGHGLLPSCREEGTHRNRGHASHRSAR